MVGGEIGGGVGGKVTLKTGRREGGISGGLPEVEAGGAGTSGDGAGGVSPAGAAVGAGAPGGAVASGSLGAEGRDSWPVGLALKKISGQRMEKNHEEMK